MHRNLGWILSHFFIRHAFTQEAKLAGENIVSNVKDALKKRLRESWMEDAVMRQAVQKLENMGMKIGYPTKSPNVEDPAAIKDMYKNVPVSAWSFFNNTLRMRQLVVGNRWLALGKPMDRDLWMGSLPTVDAHYDPSRNEIVIPAGIMRFPLFSIDLPAYVSYGALGSLAGHEIGHAFDSEGRRYDQNGNYTDWWTEPTVAEFERRARCYIDQYSRFSIPGLDGKPVFVNGLQTLAENIADATGLAAAFEAWKLTRGISDPDLPGLEFFSHEQLFFLSYANFWCGKSRTEAAVTRIRTDPHAPNWARILGTVANSRGFRESFRCRERDPACQIW